MVFISLFKELYLWMLVTEGDGGKKHCNQKLCMIYFIECITFVYTPCTLQTTVYMGMRRVTEKAVYLGQQVYLNLSRNRQNITK